MEFLIGKAIPYFLIALTDVLVAVLMGQMLFGVVMKASFWLMILASSLYYPGRADARVSSSPLVTKSQLVANQMAVLLTYLPSLLLSNFVFPVVNMPKVAPDRRPDRSGDLLHRHPERAFTSETSGSPISGRATWS